jgi:CRISPR-associated protein Csx16
MAAELGPVLFSFLGTGDYKPTCYALSADLTATIETPFVAVALARLSAASEVVVFATKEAETKNGTLLRNAFTAAAIPEPSVESLPSGQRSAELWDAFDRIRESLEARAERPVLFDITHGFRAQPFFAAAVIAYVRALGRGPEDLRVVYGAWEARDPETNVTPIWDLTTFSDLIDWSNALQRLVSTGDAAGVAGLADALGRRLARDWAAGGKQGPRPELEKLARALRGFGEAFATLRFGELLLGKPRCSGGGKGSCADELLRNIESSRTEVGEVAPPLAPLLDEIAAMARPLAGSYADLRDPAGQRALAALVKLYLRFGRVAEGAAALREAWVTAYAEPGATVPGDEQGFDKSARTRAEERFNRLEAAAKSIADVRNDIEHAGFRSRPLPPRTIREQLNRLAEEFESKLDAGDLPCAWVDAEQSARTYFVTRHPGARDWARTEGIVVDELIEHLDTDSIQAGDTVIGSLPVNLAAEVCARGGRYLHLTLPLPPELRGRDLTAEDMRRLGARVERFRIVREE